MAKGLLSFSTCTPNHPARAGGDFLPATLPHPAEGEVQLTHKEKKAKICTVLRGGKRGKHRQGQTAVGFNFIMCQHCFSSSFCSSFLQIVDWAYKQGLASWYPEPADKETFVKQHIYNSDYDSFVFDDYRWPPAAMYTQKV